MNLKRAMRFGHYTISTKLNCTLPLPRTRVTLRLAIEPLLKMGSGMNQSEANSPSIRISAEPIAAEAAMVVARGANAKTRVRTFRIPLAQIRPSQREVAIPKSVTQRAFTIGKDALAGILKAKNSCGRTINALRK